MARVKKIDGPLLVVGLGGTGFDAVMRIKKAFSQRFETEKLPDGSYTDSPARTEYLVIDTDNSVQSTKRYGMKLKPTEFCSIAGKTTPVLAAMNAKQYIGEWVDGNIAKTSVNEDGAGGIRQIARLFLFNQINSVISALTGKISSLAKVPHAAVADAKTKEVQIKIISGIAGGTGSGTLMDVAYIIKYVAKLTGATINAEAYLLMPDVSLDHAGADAVKKQMYYTNGYGLLKELDYWMNADKNHAILNQQYDDTLTIRWEGAPFNDVFLLSAKNEEGQPLERPYEVNIETISEYLLHCYESSDVDGNETKVTYDKNGTLVMDSAFSFKSARSNQDTIVNMMSQPYPRPYRYHSLGAFSNAGEDHLMELTEWELIYGEVMTHFNAHKAVMRGQAPEDFKKATLSLTERNATPAGMVRHEFDQRYRIPELSEDFDINTLWGVAEQAAPHKVDYPAFEKTIRTANADEEGILTKKVWEVFSGEAKNICTDLNRGPQYLYDLISQGQNALTEQLELFIQEVQSKYNNASKQVPTLATNSANAFRAFKEHRVLGIPTRDKTLYATYMTHVFDLFDATRAEYYYKALLAALQEMQKRLAKFSAVLGDMVGGIIKRSSEIKQEIARAQVASPLFNTTQMTQSLTMLFADQERRDTFTKNMYNAVMDTVLRCMDAQVDSDDLPNMVQDALDNLRENEFIVVGGLSLSQKIINFNGVSAAKLKDHVEQILAPKFHCGAKVMFAPTDLASGLPDSKAASVSLVFVPVGETDIQSGIAEYCKNSNIAIVLKQTINSDRVFWVNDKGGMPLCFYGELAEMRNQYAMSKGKHPGYHLFMANTNAKAADGMPDPLKQNWIDVMPDPEIFRAAPDIGATEGKLREAIEDRVLDVDISWPMDGINLPDAVISYNELKKIDSYPATETTVKKALGELVTVEDALNLPNAKSSLDALKAKLEEINAARAKAAALKDEPLKTELTIDHLKDKAKAWSERNILNCYNDMIALSPIMDETTIDRIKQAWTNSYGRAVREALRDNLSLMKSIDAQTACRKLIDERVSAYDESISSIKGKINAIAGALVNEDAVKTAAGKIAKYWMYNLIVNKPMQIVVRAADDDENDRTLYDDSTVCDALTNSFDESAAFPRLVRLAVYMSHDGREKPIFEDLEARYMKVSNRMTKKEDADSEVEAVYRAAEKALVFIKKQRATLKDKYNDEEIKKESFAFCDAVLAAMSVELKAFVAAWEDYI